MFYFDKINGYKVLKSDLGLNVGLNHCFTTRRLNMSQVKTVIPNLFRNLTNLEVKKQDYKTLKRVQGDIKIISPQQTHSDHVKIVDERIEYPDTDGIRQAASGGQAAGIYRRNRRLYDQARRRR